MEAMYEDRYRDELSDIFSSILKIDTCFGNLKKRAKVDYEKGLISEEVYSKVVEAGYYTVLDGDASAYALSEEDRALVLKFVSLTEDGNLYLNSISDSFNDLVGRMDNIANSVKTYFRYYDMDLNQLKQSVIELITEKYSEKKLKIQLDMDVLCSQLNGEVSGNAEYDELVEKMKKVTEDERVVCANVMNSSYETLMEFIVKRFSINLDFCKWYRVRKNKDALNNGTLVMDSEDSIRENELLNEYNEVSFKNGELRERINGIQEYSDGFLIDALAIDPYVCKINISNKYTKRECYMIFEKFYNIPLFLDYCTSYVKDGESINIVETFNRFYDKTFGSQRFVDAELFKSALIRDVLIYYNCKKINCKKMIDPREESLLTELNDVNARVVVFDKRKADALSDLSDTTDYLRGYISSDMKDLLYESLNEYFIYMNQYGSDDTQLSKK